MGYKKEVTVVKTQLDFFDNKYFSFLCKIIFLHCFSCSLRLPDHHTNAMLRFFGFCLKFCHQAKASASPQWAGSISFFFPRHNNALPVRESNRESVNLFLIYFSDPCFEHSCDHICLVNSTGGAFCVCANGYGLQEDGKSCGITILEDNFILGLDSAHERIYQVNSDKAL